MEHVAHIYTHIYHSQVPEGSGEQGEETGRDVICGPQPVGSGIGFRDRQRKRWEDNIREWTDLEFGKSQRAVENREEWRKLVAKSSVVPQRPSRLRN